MDKHIRRLDQDLKKFEHELDLQKKEQSTSYAKPKRLAPIAQPGVLPSAPIPTSSQPFQAAPPSERQEASRSRKYVLPFLHLYTLVYTFITLKLLF